MDRDLAFKPRIRIQLKKLCTKLFNKEFSVLEKNINDRSKVNNNEACANVLEKFE